MATLYDQEVPELLPLSGGNLPVVCNWQGRKALHLSGEQASLLVIPDLALSEGWIELDVGADGTAYPGIAFRIQDSLNYELAYIQPHTSGKWDAIQYDPVFHGSNTWQLYYGPGAQIEADTPPKEWHKMRIDFEEHRALIQVGVQDPLVIPRLAHIHRSGGIGLWTYLPAYFSNLRVGDDSPMFDFSGVTGPLQELPPGLVGSWLLEGYGAIEAEPHGILNLNRYLPIQTREATLIREIEVHEGGNFEFSPGFSDQLILEIDGDIIFQGENTFAPGSVWEERGYVSIADGISHYLSAGVHRITARLKATEPFGFGIALIIEGENYTLFPPQISY
jgi:hypothetical protein